MNEDKHRIALAEACGWTWKPGYVTPYGADRPLNIWFAPNGKAAKSGPPDYPNDLNAMHEAEKTALPKNKRTEYHETLYKICGGLSNAIDATAAQRFEALLRTIGKWEGAA
jgi:hypothetical protein